MRETKTIFLGDIIFPMTIMYSLRSIPSIELNTSACSRLGELSLTVAEA